MKQMDKIIFLPILVLTLVSGLLFSNRERVDEPKSTSLPSAAATDNKPVLDERKKWEVSPDGIKYKAWEASPEGKKVQSSYVKIKKYLDEFSDMEAEVTSLNFRRTNGNASSPKWMIVKINGEEYMMQFIPKEFEQLSSLQVKDKIIIKSRSAGLSPNHPYLIISSDYIERNKKVLFKRAFSKNNGC